MKEFEGASILEKVAFSALRVIQHLAYRRGYGHQRVAAQLPTCASDKFRTMNSNIAELPDDIRLQWVKEFLWQVNKTPNVAPNPYPVSVVFELSSTCNFNCLNCGVGRNGVDLGRTMPVARLQKWAREACSTVKQLRINGLGEATLHPDFGRCIDILDEYPCAKEIITNGSAPLATYERLLESKYVILVSWDAAQRDVFQAIRRGACFDELLKKLPRISTSAVKNNAPEPVLLFTLRPENITELPDVVGLASHTGIPKVTVNTLKLTNDGDWTAPFYEEINNTFGKAEEVADKHSIKLALPDHLGSRRISSPYARRCSSTGCHFPRTQAVVRWNGAVTPCNMMNPFCYGELTSSNFEKCWNSAEARCFRRMANTDFRHPYCQHCYYVDPI